MRKRLAKLTVSVIAVFSVFLSTAYAASLSDLMYSAFEPVGKCLYVYGGGWNEPDTGAGPEALKKGVSESWTAFYDSNSSAYDYTKTRYRIHDGLDCTGYVGWCMYQLFENAYAENGYVFPANGMARQYAAIFNGDFTEKQHVVSRECGDILSSSGHAFIVVGECRDKSVVLLHAAPPAVSLCGTPTPDGNADSEAVRLAGFYMNTFFPECSERYPDRCVGKTYLTNFDRMSWNSDVLTDPDGYRTMSAEELLNDLFFVTKIYINGERAAKDQPIYNMDSSLYVPLRTVSEKLGATVRWEDGRITVTRGEVTAVFFIDSDRATVNGKKRDLGHNVFLSDNTTYVPLRAVSELFGCSVRWDPVKSAAYVD